MITHFVVQFDHDSNEWRVDDDGTMFFIGSIMPDRALTFVENEPDWIRLPETDMVVLRSELADLLNGGGNARS